VPASGPSAPDAASVSVPTLVGRPALEAFEAAIRAGLRPRVALAAEPGAPDPVRRQEPAAGAAARAGAVVTLTIGPGSGAAPADVPDVTGLATSEAAARLRAAGRTARVFRVQAPTGVFPDPDRVLAQTPVGRVALAPDAPVLLFVVR
jgi:beta-lactam-binding protein with PASTA domain